MTAFNAHIRISPDGKRICQTVQEHCDACACYAGQALEGVGLKQTAELCGKLHDGKMTRAYQEYLDACAQGLPVRRGSVPHTFAPVRFLLEKYHSGGADGIEALTAEWVAYAIGAHHGLFDCSAEDGTNGFEHRRHSEDGLYREHMQNVFRYYLSETEIDQMFQRAVQEICDVGQRFSDGEAKDEEAEREEHDFAYGALARLLLSAVIEGDRRDTALFMSGRAAPAEKAADWDACLQALERHLAEIPPNALSEARRTISEKCFQRGRLPGKRFRLNVPTGAGKTLSALRFALAQCRDQGKKRIFFVMPLLAIIEQNAKAIRTALGSAVEVLEHHSNVVTPASSSEELDEWELMCESWHAPIVCTTLVQFLDTLFSGKTSCIRRFQALCQSVIVIDEVQSVPISMLSPFHLMLNFLTDVCDAVIVLCSATQPTETDPAKTALRHPLRPVEEMAVIAPEDAPKFRRTEIFPPPDAPLTMAEAAQLCREQLRQADTLLVGCNTRREAAELFGMLQEMGLPCVHLSAAMCAKHREQVLEQIKALRPGEKIICVSTQVIEYGVDVSFQRVIRFLTGLDEIVQIAGRCNRNSEAGGQLGQVLLVRLRGENLSDLNEIRQGQNAAAFVLNSFQKDPEKFNGRLDSDAALRKYYRLFWDGLKDDAADSPLDHHGRKMLDLLATHTHGKEKDGLAYYLHQAFREAGDAFHVFPEGTTELVVPYGEGAELLAQLCELDLTAGALSAENIVRSLRPFTVSVYPHQLESLKKAGALEWLQPGKLDLPAVRPAFYHPEQGLVFSA